ncbi:hypothetical protein [Streptomyces sp. NRRL S-237]|uniref:hypothetical protein n=1 Tax=Streptomyces sp. NRRL S-237 TaxID=1463895 RepID=UPI0004CB7BE4|nr:hypothetical protein [Streptomyces sp. NRRL S-237]
MNAINLVMAREPIPAGPSVFLAGPNNRSGERRIHVEMDEAEIAELLTELGEPTSHSCGSWSRS